MKKNKSCTKYFVDLAMKLASKDVLSPKCVRNGLVESIKQTSNQEKANNCSKGGYCIYPKCNCEIIPNSSL